MKNKPLISIILPVCEAEKYLADCITTIKRQSYKNFEVIAIDDNSKDRSYQILKNTRKKDKRFRIYKNKNKYGLAITLNRALRRVKGTYIAFMEPTSQNYYHRIKTQLSFLLTNPKVAAVGSQCKFIDKKGKIIEKSSFPLDQEAIQKNLVSAITIQPETFMINKELLPKDLLTFDNKPYPYLFSDLLMKITNYATIANLPRSLMYLRKNYNAHTFQMDRLEELIEHTKLWIKTRTTHENKPSLKSFFVPLVK